MRTPDQIRDIEDDTERWEQALIEIASQEHAPDCTHSCPLNECTCLDGRDPRTYANAALRIEG